jgi:hypothetical protein
MFILTTGATSIRLSGTLTLLPQNAILGTAETAILKEWPIPFDFGLGAVQALPRPTDRIYTLTPTKQWLFMWQQGTEFFNFPLYYTPDGLAFDTSEQVAVDNWLRNFAHPSSYEWRLCDSGYWILKHKLRDQSFTILATK